MKSLKMFMIGMIALAGVTISNKTLAQPGFRANVSFNVFYNELSPYGRWISMPRYGQVWIYSDPNFRPYYTNGYWMDTNLGWAWESSYPWGWAPFHYGRWEYDPMYGWFWIPGYDYAPAWVVWSQADDYYGWAPLGFGVDINISIGSIPSYRWMYAQSRYMGHRRIDRYCIPYQRNTYYYQRQQPVVNVNVYNNVRYDRGPRRDYQANGNGSRPGNWRNDNRQQPVYDRPDYNNNNNGRRPNNINSDEINRRFDERRNNVVQDGSRNGSRRRELTPVPAAPAPINRDRAITENRPVPRNNNVVENRETFRNRVDNNVGRRLENPGQRQRVLRAEASR